jgi:hypothetical protein
MKLPLLHSTRIHAPKGHFGNCRHSTIRQIPGNRTLLHLNTSFTIQTRVFYFEASQHVRITSPPAELSVLAVWLNLGSQRFCGEPPQTPRT